MYSLRSFLPLQLCVDRIWVVQWLEHFALEILFLPLSYCCCRLSLALVFSLSLFISFSSLSLAAPLSLSPYPFCSPKSKFAFLLPLSSPLFSFCVCCFTVYFSLIFSPFAAFSLSSDFMYFGFWNSSFEFLLLCSPVLFFFFFFFCVFVGYLCFFRLCLEHQFHSN